MDKSLAFKSHSTKISTGLRGFCDQLLHASLKLNKMYREGIHLYKFFDKEIGLIMTRFSLDLSYRKGDIEHLFEKINSMMFEFQEFEKLVKQTNSLTDSLEQYRHATEAHIIDGSRGAQKFASRNDHESTPESNIAKEEIEVIGDILSKLHNTAIYLDKVKKILMAYEEDLSDFLVKFENIGKDKNGIFEISMQDAKYLEFSVGALKSIHYRFIQE